MLNINNSSNLLINTSFNRGNYLQIMATVNNDAKFCKNGDESKTKKPLAIEAKSLY
ncbi:hypothetical protein [Lactobacillus amylovorus]|uniref:hypothetical protein n=1 Tax=Lactobacillus amylovorus TaxID=1604 RepID=UPI003F8FBD0A